MAAKPYARNLPGLKARLKAFGELVPVEDAPGGNEFLDLFDRVDREFRWGAVWSRPGMDQRTRCMLALAMVAGKGQTDAVGTHVRMCLAAGVSRMEIGEVLVQVYCYAGAYAAMGAFRAAQAVFEELERTGRMPQQPRAHRIRNAPTATVAARVADGLAIRHRVFGRAHLAKKLAGSDPFLGMFDTLTHEFCFGDIWGRPGLDWKMRSQLCLAIASAGLQFGAVDRHTRSALQRGLSKKRIGEIFLLAYAYGGVYACLGSFLTAKQVFDAIDREQADARRRPAAKKRGRA